MALNLGQIGPVVLAVAQPQQSVRRRIVVIDAHTGAVQPHRLGRQGVHRDPIHQQRPVHRGLVRRVTQHGQRVGQAVIRQIRVAQRDAQQRVHGLRPGRHPVTLTKR